MCCRSVEKLLSLCLVIRQTGESRLGCAECIWNFLFFRYRQCNFCKPFPCVCFSCHHKTLHFTGRVYFVHFQEPRECNRICASEKKLLLYHKIEPAFYTWVKHFWCNFSNHHIYYKKDNSFFETTFIKMSLIFVLISEYWVSVFRLSHELGSLWV